SSTRTTRRTLSLRFSKRRFHLRKELILPCNIAAQGASRRQKWHAHSCCLQCQRHREVGHVDNLHAALFHRSPEVISRAHHHVSHPGGNHSFDTSSGNQLIEQNVGYRSNQC